MNFNDLSEYVCAECDQGGHCYGRDNICTCGCKFVEPRQDAKKYFKKNYLKLSPTERNKYLENPDIFVERFLNEFQAQNEGEYDNNQEFFLLFGQYLRNYPNNSTDAKENDNFNPSRPRLS